MRVVSRRGMMRSAAAFTIGSLTGTMPYSPISLFFGSRANATVPVTTASRVLSERQFWFRRLGDAALANPNLPAANRTAIASPDGQLTMRLGHSGGFAIGYFATLTFLNAYRTKQPDDYLDLFKAIAGLASQPDNPAVDKPTLALAILADHRKYAATAAVGTPLVQSQGVDIAGASSALPPLATSQLPPISSPAVCSTRVCTLEKLSDQYTMQISQSALMQTDLNQWRMEALAFDGGGTPPPNWQEASKAAQDFLDGDFKTLNPTIENDARTTDTTKLSTYDASHNLKYPWLQLLLLAPAFQDGIDAGRVAALSYFGFIEATQQLKGPAKAGTKIDQVNRRLGHFTLAHEMLNTFGQNEFGNFGLDFGSNRPAIRLKNICYVSNTSGDKRRIELTSPYLPFEFEQRGNPTDRHLLDDANSKYVSEIIKRFSNPVDAITNTASPQPSVVLTDGAFPSCAEVYRHTARLMAKTSEKIPELRNTKIENVVLIPEATSPWTFAGIGAALCTTHLLHIAPNQLTNQQDRLKFRTSVLKSVNEVITSSVVATKDQNANLGISGPALLGYADGFRMSYLLSDRVADQAAQASGAAQVYTALQKSLPEYFPDLPSNGFLTSDAIASSVEVIGKSIKAELDDLKLRIKGLESELDQMKQFVSDLDSLIRQLGSSAAGINNLQALKNFQDNANSLIATRLSRGLNDLEQKTLSSLQGLVNTFVQVGVNITTTIQASVRGSVNMCGIQNTK